MTFFSTTLNYSIDNMKKTAWFLLTILAVSSVCDAAKILIVFGLPGKSHAILGEGLVNRLLNAGHEVTYITPFPPKNSSNPKLHVVDVSLNIKLMGEKTDFYKVVSFEDVLDGRFDNSDPSIFYYMMDVLSKITLENENVQKLLRDKSQNFDMVIAEWMYSELYTGIAGLFDAHFVWASTFEPHWMILSLIDDYTNPSYNGFVLDDSPPYNFGQRVFELYYFIKMVFIRETIGYYLQTTGYNNILVPIYEARGKVAPSFSEVRYNATLTLGNSHVSLGQAVQLPQSYKVVGGYHIDENVKPLPEDLKKLLDNAKHGLIYFSMGTNLQSKNMPDKLKKSLIEMFGTLKQTVLWKFEEKLPNLPKNVHIMNWAPQQSILAHPNCVLFITHGGLLSTTETTFAGKPIIGIPVFADQFLNVARAVKKGYARKVALSYALPEHLKKEIEEILGNPKYTQRAKELSFVYHDRIATPGQELVHWVNHVLKTNGAPHLRSAALLVPWYQKYYLDLAAIIVIALILLKKAIKTLLSAIKPKKVEKSKKKN